MTVNAQTLLSFIPLSPPFSPFQLKLSSPSRHLLSRFPHHLCPSFSTHPKALIQANGDQQHPALARITPPPPPSPLGPYLTSTGLVLLIPSFLNVHPRTRRHRAQLQRQPSYLPSHRLLCRRSPFDFHLHRLDSCGPLLVPRKTTRPGTCQTVPKYQGSIPPFCVLWLWLWDQHSDCAHHLQRPLRIWRRQRLGAPRHPRTGPLVNTRPSASAVLFAFHPRRLLVPSTVHRPSSILSSRREPNPVLPPTILLAPLCILDPRDRRLIPSFT
ncbi:hypothetical protein B0T10DRAFT_320770 [Thelonectria olida]|uniref:Uncharacterized protein n=1 Tax=Thelonectria olida TaxID=1576542 RepID=A0A9P9AT61_9HYPO|nr:hypothetical protein B0T10DRAFT_320770 [Thelonectria olida]